MSADASRLFSKQHFWSSLGRTHHWATIAGWRVVAAASVPAVRVA